MGSSNSQIYDSIRQCWVKKTPEECVRQRILLNMVHQLGYPPKMLAVEKELARLPHLSLDANLPKRRIDILAYGIEAGKLFPLLMIECKAIKLTAAFAQQVVGYNSAVQAPFLALANGEEVLTGCYEEEVGHFVFKPGLLSYAALLDKVVIR